MERRSAGSISPEFQLGLVQGRLDGVEKEIKRQGEILESLDKKLDTYNEAVLESKTKTKVYIGAASMVAGLISFVTGLGIDRFWK